jgi:hypothetical protein
MRNENFKISICYQKAGFLILFEAPSIVNYLNIRLLVSASIVEMGAAFPGHELQSDVDHIKYPLIDITISEALAYLLVGS